MVATIVWQNSETLKGILDIKAAAVLISAALVASVSLVTRPPGAARDSSTR
jgi:hypothetical protein